MNGDAIVVKRNRRASTAHAAFKGKANRFQVHQVGKTQLPVTQRLDATILVDK